MIAHLNDIAQIWWLWMGSMLWQVSLLIILVTILDMIIRRWAWPQVRYALWGLVFLKLIIPPTWQMPTSIVSRVQPQVEKEMSIQIGAMDWYKTNLEVQDLNELSQDKGKEPIIIKEPETKAKVTWQTFALAGWIAGMAIISFLLVRKMSKFRKSHQIQEGDEIPEWFHNLMFITAQRLKIKKIPSITFSKDFKSPAVYGLSQPVLLLPDGYLDQLSKEQAEHVLMHELCHLKRGDVWVHCFCIALQIIYWFNPLLILSRRQMRYVGEICCDLSVANILREKTLAYRNTLLNGARELFPETMEPSLGLLGIFEEPFRLVPRLKWLEKKSWENRKRRIALTIFVSLGMITCVMPMAGISKLAAQDSDFAVRSNFEPFDPNSQKIYDAGSVSRKTPMAGISKPGAQNNTHTVQSDIDPIKLNDQHIKGESNISGKAIYLESLILEVDVKKKFEMGVEWVSPLPGSQIDRGDSATMPNGYSFGVFNRDIIIDGESFKDLAELSRKMQKEPEVNILSTPKVLMPNGSPVEIPIEKLERPGLSLIMIPRIKGDNIIQQEITLVITELIESESNGGPPTTLNKYAKTTVAIKGGNTIAIVPPENVDTITEKKLINRKNFYILLTPQIVVDQASRYTKLQQINGYIADLKSRIDETNKQIKQYEAKVEGTPKREQELLHLNRDYNRLKAIYDKTLDKKLEAEKALSMERKILTESQTLASLDNELKAHQKRLIEKEAQIRNYKERHMGGLPEQLQTNLAIIEKLEMESEKLINGLKDLEMKRAALLKELTASMTPKDADDSLTYLKKALSLLESRYAQEHPDIIRLKEMIANLEAEE